MVGSLRNNTSLIKLNNDSKEDYALVAVTMLALKQLIDTKPIHFYELVW